MTFLRMQKEVFSLLRDSLGYEDANKLLLIKEWLNEGEKQIAAKTDYKITTNSSTTTVAGTQEYTLPSGVNDVFEVTYDGEPLEQINQFKTIEKTTTTGTPAYYYITANKVGLWPVPSEAKTLKIWYSALGGDMSDDEDTSILPEEWHMCIVYYAALHYAVDRDDSKKNDFATLYKMALDDAIVQSVQKEYSEEWPQIGNKEGLEYHYRNKY